MNQKKPLRDLLRQPRNVRALAGRVVHKALREGMGWLYSAPQGLPQRVAYGPLRALNTWVQNGNAFFPGLARASSADGCVLRGSVQVSGRLLRAAFIGGWEGAAPGCHLLVERLLFRDGAAEWENLGPVAEKQYRDTAARLAREVDLLVVSGSSRALWQPERGDWVMGPAGLRMVFDFHPGEPWGNAAGRMGQSAALRMFRQNGLTYHTSRREDDFQFFYHNMYAPLAQRRDPGCQEIVREADAHTVFERGGSVLMVEDARGQRVAGGLVFHLQKVMFGCLEGVLDGSQELIEQGALGAWLYFGMKWAFESGCRRFDSGAVQPFLSDGLYLDRRAWGCQPAADLWQPGGLLLWAPESSPDALQWLEENRLHPHFASWGGSHLQPLYGALRSQETPSSSTGSAPARKWRDIPVTEVLEGEEEPAARMPAAGMPAAGMLAENLPVADFHFEVSGARQKDVLDAVQHGLFQHSLEKLGPEMGNVFKPFTIAVRDQKSRVVGGLNGSLTWNFLHIDHLWVSPDHRGNDLGTRLMRIAENAAREGGMDFITLETTSFEAIHFYTRFGYQITGQIENMPPGHTYYYLHKALRDSNT